MHRTHADAHRVALGGISMGGFGALDLARLWPRRFCAGAHTRRLSGFAEATHRPAPSTTQKRFARHDVLAAARSRRIYDVPVWIDVGRDDPFAQADAEFARALSEHGTRVSYRLHDGGHGG